MPYSLRRLEVFSCKIIDGDDVSKPDGACTPQSPGYENVKVRKVLELSKHDDVD